MFLPLNPKPDTEFHRLNGRLALFHKNISHQDYWRLYWSASARGKPDARGRTYRVGEFESLVKEYVPRNLPVLEAGCGPAHLVAALETRGYRTMGIDSEPEVVRFVNEALPHLDVRVGDVLNLDLESESIGCYLSVGVVEHFIAGPGAALREARRVLHPAGVALISVPYLNPARKRLWRSLANEAMAESEADADSRFHQYYFDIQDFSDVLNKTGFRVIATMPYAVGAYLIREHPLFARLWRSSVIRGRLRRKLRAWFRDAPAAMRRRYGHMVMFVCKK